ncbi:MAG: extracellular solute-binding protein, partial [Chloroflexi bacterium]|nr:extracellular solute-binding protein [Chloroflexota bacterium]
MASTRRLLSRRVVVRGVVQSALGVGLGALLSACSGGAGSAKKPQATLRLATMEGNGQAPRTRAYLKEFQKSTGIAVSLISVSNYYTQNIHAMVAGGLPPDALFLTRTEFDDLTSRNHLVDLQARFQQDSSLVHAFFPIALQEWTRGGKLFALPSGIRVLFATYNTDLFREYGEPFPPAS